MEADGEALAERAAGRQVLPRERLVNHGNDRLAGGVALREFAAEQHGGAQGVEVAAPLLDSGW